MVFHAVHAAERMSNHGAHDVQVNVMPTADGKAAVTLTELATGSFVMDMDTLGTRGTIRYRDSVKGAMTTAHPSVQPDGSLINFTSDVRNILSVRGNPLQVAPLHATIVQHSTSCGGVACNTAGHMGLVRIVCCYTACGAAIRLHRPLA